jgi:hypothetical protein
MWECPLKPSLHSITLLRRRWNSLVVEMWNQLYPPGTPVAFWLDFRPGDTFYSETSGPAELTECLIPMISIRAYEYSLHLTHVEPMVLRAVLPQRKEAHHEHAAAWSRSAVAKRPA